MDKLQYLKRVRSLLKSIIAQRKYLLVNSAGHIDGKWATTEIRNVENAVSAIKSADKAQVFIRQKETALRFLIPSSNKKRQEELRELIQTELN